MHRLPLRWLVAAAIALPCAARADLPGLLVEQVASVSNPVYVTHAGDDRLFLVERAGRILIHTSQGGVQPTPFLNIASLVNTQGEGGLLSVAFHPDYATNGYFYVSYTRSASDPNGLLDSVIARYSTFAGDPDRADPNSGVVLLQILQPLDNHNGGQLQFGPNDGYLYASFGDGGGAGDAACNAQRPDNLLGSLLRLDVDQSPAAPPYHGIPPDNPFGGLGEPPAEVWATGLRNPWRFSFDRATGDLYIGDVGQNAWEEVDRQPAASSGGENYGWKVMEGDVCFDPDPIDTDCPAATPSCFDARYMAPIHVYAHGGGHCSITGGFVYRGSELPGLVGSYVFGDWCTGQIWALDEVGSTWQTTEVVSVGQGLTSFGEDAAGELYMTVGADVLRLSSSFQGGVEPRCVNELLRGFVKVGKTRARDVSGCIRAGSRGKLSGRIEDCVTADAKGRVAKAQQKAIERAGRKCQGPGSGGPLDAPTVNTAATQGPLDLVHAPFGGDLDSAIVDAHSQQDGARCQRAVERALRRCYDAFAGEFARCAKGGLKQGTIVTVADLDTCVGADPRGKVARLCDPALAAFSTRTVPRLCDDKGVDLSDAFSGCASDDPAEVSSCLARSAACHVCRAINQAADLSRDCDLLDDAVANASCP